MEGLSALNVRVGTVRTAVPNAKARTPAVVLTVDFGPFGLRTTSAQLAARYAPDDLVGRQVVCALGFPSKRVAGVVSECLVLAAVPAPGDAVLLAPAAPVPDGTPVA